MKLSSKSSTAAKKTVETRENTPIDTVDDSELIDRLLTVYVDNPKVSLRKAGAIVGLSHTGVSNMLDRMEEQRLIHRNGNGVEIRANGHTAEA